MLSSRRSRHLGGAALCDRDNRDALGLVGAANDVRVNLFKLIYSGSDLPASWIRILWMVRVSTVRALSQLYLQVRSARTTFFSDCGNGTSRPPDPGAQISQSCQRGSRMLEFPPHRKRYARQVSGSSSLCGTTAEQRAFDWRQNTFFAACSVTTVALRLSSGRPCFFLLFISSKHTPR